MHHKMKKKAIHQTPIKGLIDKYLYILNLYMLEIAWIGLDPTRLYILLIY